MNLKTYTSKQRGNATRLSRDLDVDQSLVSLWASGARPIPAERCLEIEKITEGIVTCEELRPDVDWAYLRGTLPNSANPNPVTANAK